jgi:hypothetical protein
MKIISHRGNYNGVYPERENKPSYIDTALAMGYDVEIDLRILNGRLYLGHDTPDTEISEKWIELRKENLWIHCKDLDSARYLKNMDIGAKYFCHSTEEFVLTSTGHIWVHNLKLELDETCIIPLLDVESIEEYDMSRVFAICTDFINICKSKGIK